MGNRPRIAKPTAQQKARTAVRELYSDLIDNLSNAECDLIVNARIDGLGPIFIIDMVNKRREKCKAAALETERMYAEMKNAREQS